ncbi:hypothetical protein C2845_PM06G33440 [Panicum miliaceum]|uniref:Uncharacterized protein n=1 Tax=Panicum miliaceum TaxID=4540 RepID=A0A3L6RB76_PANMI|nr:hypothetical protein C2845_PM06G33440 [Panicum miliaceum]
MVFVAIVSVAMSVRMLGSLRSCRSTCLRVLLFTVTFVSELLGVFYLLPPSLTLSVVLGVLTIYLLVCGHLLAWTTCFW